MPPGSHRIIDEPLPNPTSKTNKDELWVQDPVMFIYGILSYNVAVLD